MTVTSEDRPRRLRLMGDNYHGEKTVATSSNVWDVDNAPPDNLVAYRQTYIAGVYDDPRSAAVADETPFVDLGELEDLMQSTSFGCPCSAPFR